MSCVEMTAKDIAIRCIPSPHQSFRDRKIPIPPRSKWDKSGGGSELAFTGIHRGWEGTPREATLPTSPSARVSQTLEPPWCAAAGRRAHESRLGRRPLAAFTTHPLKDG